MADNSQKRENMLNMALESTSYERESSLNLGVGANENGDIWTVIVKYVGNLDFLEGLGVEVELLLGGYAILKIERSLIDYVTSTDEIIFMEKPKGLVLSQAPLSNVFSETCISAVKNVEGELNGEGVVIAVIDSGIDYKNTVFRNADGSTRIVNLWDQVTGKIYTKKDIDEALVSGEQLDTNDFSGHGTAVAAIAAGDFSEYAYGIKVSERSYGIATKADILAVKLGSDRKGGFPTTSELMRAIDYAVKYGIEVNKPIVINLSFGNTYGSHDGTSLLETYINIAASTGRTTIVTGSGNEGNVAGHTSGMVSQSMEVTEEISIEKFENSLNIQLWKNYVDIFEVTITAPDGESFAVKENKSGVYRYNTINDIILIYYGEPKPYSIYQEIYIDIIPDNQNSNDVEKYISTGIWKISIYGRKIADGKYDMWLPASATLNGTGFTRPTPDTTLTIPSTAYYAITVGAYDSYTGNYASFSGRGYNRNLDVIKPDIVAPGVNIGTTTSGGGVVEVSGTSFAAPIVSGMAALLGEYGIVRGNDIYMYGEKVKAHLIRNARKFSGEVTPNKRTGWGRACLNSSIEAIIP